MSGANWRKRSVSFRPKNAVTCRRPRPRPWTNWPGAVANAAPAGEVPRSVWSPPAGRRPRSGWAGCCEVPSSTVGFTTGRKQTFSLSVREDRIKRPSIPRGRDLGNGAPTGQYSPVTSQAPRTARRRPLWSRSPARGDRGGDRKEHRRPVRPCHQEVSVPEQPSHVHGAPARVFADRHVGPNPAETEEMLKTVGHGSTAELMAAAVPESILTGPGRQAPLDLPEPAGEAEALTELRGLAARNQVTTSLIGRGYYGTHVPPVILRNILENPAWYTAYTPYQPEISQGRLEAL